MSQDPLDRAHRATQECLALIGLVGLVLAVAGFVTDHVMWVLAAAVFVTGGSALVFFVFASGMRK